MVWTIEFYFFFFLLKCLVFFFPWDCCCYIRQNEILQALLMMYSVGSPRRLENESGMSKWIILHIGYADLIFGLVGMGNIPCHWEVTPTWAVRVFPHPGVVHCSSSKFLLCFCCSEIKPSQLLLPSLCDVMPVRKTDSKSSCPHMPFSLISYFNCIQF